MDTAFKNIEALTSPYARQLKEGFRRLHFVPDLEAEFRAHYEEQLLTRVRPALLIGIIAFAAFALWDIVALPKIVSQWTLIIRFAWVYPAFFLTWYASKNAVLQKYITLFIFGTVLIAGSGIVAIVWIARFYHTPLPYEGIILLTMATYLLTGLLFYKALCCSGIVFLCYLVSECCVGYPVTILVSNAIFLFFANIIGMSGSYTLERTLRTNYLKTKLLEELADRDGLTGIYNRRMFNTYLEKIWAQASREQKSLTLALIDVDHFKKFNDHYGHLAGDECLKKVAKALQLVIKRPLDLAARYGGEEFVLVRYQATSESMSEFAEEIRSAVAILRLPHPDSSVGSFVTVSIGIAYTIPNETFSLKAFIQDADASLYEAKTRGRNQACCRTYPTNIA